MKIFVLEDNNERTSYFSLMFMNHELVITNNASIGLTILMNEKFNVLFLDHDLGGKVYVSNNEPNTGHYLCKHVHETLNTDTPIVIHSWNENGVKNMFETLRNNNHNGDIDIMMFLSDEFHRKIKDILISDIGESSEQKSGLKTSYQVCSGK